MSKIIKNNIDYSVNLSANNPLEITSNTVTLKYDSTLKLNTSNELSTNVTWGDITGTLSNQADLNTELTSINNNITTLQTSVTNLNNNKTDKTSFVLDGDVLRITI